MAEVSASAVLRSWRNLPDKGFITRDDILADAHRGGQNRSRPKWVAAAVLADDGLDLRLLVGTRTESKKVGLFGSNVWGNESITEAMLEILRQQAHMDMDPQQLRQCLVGIASLDGDECIFVLASHFCNLDWWKATHSVLQAAAGRNGDVAESLRQYLEISDVRYLLPPFAEPQGVKLTPAAQLVWDLTAPGSQYRDYLHAAFRTMKSADKFHCSNMMTSVQEGNSQFSVAAAELPAHQNEGILDFKAHRADRVYAMGGKGSENNAADYRARLDELYHIKQEKMDDDVAEGDDAFADALDSIQYQVPDNDVKLESVNGESDDEDERVVERNRREEQERAAMAEAVARVDATDAMQANDFNVNLLEDDTTLFHDALVDEVEEDTFGAGTFGADLRMAAKRRTETLRKMKEAAAAAAQEALKRTATAQGKSTQVSGDTLRQIQEAAAAAAQEALFRSASAQGKSTQVSGDRLRQIQEMAVAAAQEALRRSARAQSNATQVTAGTLRQIQETANAAAQEALRRTARAEEKAAQAEAAQRAAASAAEEAALAEAQAEAQRRQESALNAGLPVATMVPADATELTAAEAAGMVVAEATEIATVLAEGAEEAAEPALVLAEDAEAAAHEATVALQVAESAQQDAVHAVTVYNAGEGGAALP